MSEDEVRTDDEPNAADEPKAADKPKKEFAVVGQGSLFDGAAYWVTVIGIYLMVGGLMFYSGKEKLFDDNGNAPSAIQQQFQGSFLDKVPGVDAAWTILGILEFGVALLLILSLIRLEFLPHRTNVHAARARCRAADVRVPGLRPDGDQAVRGRRVALSVLRRDSGDHAARPAAATAPAGQLAGRFGQRRRLVIAHVDIAFDDEADAGSVAGHQRELVMAVRSRGVEIDDAPDRDPRPLVAPLVDAARSRA